ncbi:MAG: ABC transporter ATP-binding protein/permease [Atopobiaceae bacterium]|jgi:ABC-type multidrug transport system fused ATPase/permease subunit|nr:ABC transporter ATP-binding protein/permease [Atopobiaceae bacterium]MCI2050924.1 ABC transporter ATP-binding protein/permease [Atopobiaceae bacterium]
MMVKASERKMHPVRAVFVTCMREHALLTVALIAVIVASIVLALLPPYILGLIVDELVAKNASVLTLAILYVAAVIGQGLAGAGQEAAIAVFGQKVTHKLRSAMAAKLDRLPAAYFHEHDAGAISARIVNDVDAIEALFASGIVGMIIDVFQVLGIVIAIFFESTGLGILVLIALPVVALWTRWIQKTTREARRDARSAIARESAQIPETLRCLRMVQLMGAERFMEGRYGKAVDDGFAAQTRSNFCDAVYSPVVISLSSLVIALMMGLAGSGGAWAAFFGVSVGGAVTAINYVGNVFTPISDIGMEIQSIQDAGAAISRIGELLEAPEVKLPEKTGAEDRQAAVALSHVTFGYKKDAPVLEDFSLSVAPGERVTLMGRTGAGKSTVLNLVMGLYQPDRGTVSVFGEPAGSFAADERRKTLGYVEQGFRRIQGTVLDELTLGDPRVTEEQVKAALEHIGLWESVLALPEGLATPCTQGTFSEGQFQLLGIARAIVFDPPLLLLDEVTSHLDPATEAQVLSALDAAAEGRTTISVSHRLAAAGHGGRIVHIGEDAD